jgi:hypothetical protein
MVGAALRMMEQSCHAPAEINPVPEAGVVQVFVP